MGNKLRIPEWNENYIRLTSRQTAAECLKEIIKRLPESTYPQSPFFASAINEIESYMITHKPPFVLKAPYSSSGRGLLWINEEGLSIKEKERIRGVLGKQGQVSVEQVLRKEADFALEYEINSPERITYKGISFFETGEKGAYAGNRLEHQDLIKERLTGLIGEGLFSQVQQAVGEVLLEVYGTSYRGYIGVDMMIYREEDYVYAIHPCVEINMRYTMGMLAVQFFERFISPDVTGLFKVTYEKEAYIHHQKMKERYPLQWKSGKLLKGYFPLCPVFPETCYRAFILIE